MAGRKDIAIAVANKVDGITKKQADDAVQAVFESIGDLLCEGDVVQIPNFGRFSISERAAREGRNPATGEKIQIPASKNVKLKIGKDMKGRLND